MRLKAFLFLSYLSPNLIITRQRKSRLPPLLSCLSASRGQGRLLGVFFVAAIAFVVIAAVSRYCVVCCPFPVGLVPNRLCPSLKAASVVLLLGQNPAFGFPPATIYCQQPPSYRRRKGDKLHYSGKLQQQQLKWCVNNIRKWTDNNAKESS